MVLDAGRMEARLVAMGLSLTAAFDRSQAWRDGGARTAASWIRTRSRGRDSDVKRRVCLAKRAPGMPASIAALASGDITRSHVDLLAKANAKGREDMFATAEAMLVGQASRLSFKDFSKAVAYWIEVTNDRLQDGDDPPADPKVEGRSVHLSSTLDGTWRLDGDLDPLAGTEIDNELQRLCDIEFDKDWAAARKRLGRTPTVSDLARTAVQRRADALLEMARRSATTTQPGEPAARLINLRMDYPTFIAEMAHLTGQTDIEYPTDRVSETAAGTIVAPSTILDGETATWIRRIVFNSKKQVLEYGRSRRLFGGALRDAIVERDQQCTDEFCETDARYFQIDHIQEYEDDGQTNIVNRELNCGPLNLAKHLHNRQKRRRENDTE